MYVLVGTLSKENNIKILEQLKLGFKKIIKWNKYRSQITIQAKNRNLNYLINPAFTNVNTLFVLSYSRYSYSNYYVPKVEINDFNVLIDGKSFFNLPATDKEEAYEKIIEINNNNDYTTGNLLDFGYFKKNYKLIAIYLSKQTKLKDPQQINFIGKLLKKCCSNKVFRHLRIRGNNF